MAKKKVTRKAHMRDGKMVREHAVTVEAGEAGASSSMRSAAGDAAVSDPLAQGSGANYSQSGSFDDAVETARQHIEIKRQVTTNPTGYVINEVPGGKGYRVYSDEPQQPGGFLPPAGERVGRTVATVDLDGNVERQ